MVQTDIADMLHDHILQHSSTYFAHTQEVLSHLVMCWCAESPQWWRGLLGKTFIAGMLHCHTLQHFNMRLAKVLVVLQSTLVVLQELMT